MIPSVEVVLLPASRLADLAHGVGIEAYASKYHLDFDREPVLAGYARWFDALVAERALEQALHDELYRAFLLDTSKRRPRRDRIGSIAFGDETRRYALRDHASGKELRPLPTDVLDLYRDRYPNLLGMRPLSPEGGATRHRMERAEGDAASRDYTIEATVGSDHPGGPFVFYVPEFLDQRSAIVRVEHRGPEDESFRRIEAFLAGPRLVPKGLGYRLDESRREPSVVVEPIVEGVHRFRVRVVGRRF
jgi:hypothetical protein